MNLADTKRLLAFLRRVDNRDYDDATVIAWQAILADVNGEYAIEAARRHYATSQDYLKPVHIAEGARTIGNERAAAREREANQLALDAAPVVHTEDRSEEVTALLKSVVANLPQPDVHKRALDRARRERGRPEPPPRKRDRKPRKDLPNPTSNDIAALATRYLIDGYQPDAVSSLLGISSRWCHRTAARFTTRAGQESP